MWGLGVGLRLPTDYWLPSIVHCPLCAAGNRTKEKKKQKAAMAEEVVDEDPLFREDKPMFGDVVQEPPKLNFKSRRHTEEYV